MDKKETALFVVAIDFGTTFSGYAYSSRDDYKNDHTKIFSNNGWQSGEGLQTPKTPTVILFDDKKQFCKFGYEAETKYNTLLEDEDADGWRFFKQFKMRLFREQTKVLKKRTPDNITKDLMIEDVRGQAMSALVVFSESIKYFKQHFLDLDRGYTLGPDDVHFVLTVPAIWEDRAKQFMRKAATTAGIPDHMLTLAYEPEAAALYCKEITVQKKEGAESTSLSSFEPGQRFMVLDCGGGTIDVTAYQIQNDGDLRELERPTGGPWGGTYVDKQYVEFLKELFGSELWEEFAVENPEDVLDIFRKFEAKKKCIRGVDDDNPSIPFPNSLFTKYLIANQCKTVADGLKKTRFAETIEVKKDRLRFNQKLVKTFFKRPIDDIVQHVHFLLYESKLKEKGVNTILMVGGFSDSKVLTERIKAEFKGVTVICPEEAVNAIMKGAVIFGHNPKLIAERISPRTYGIRVNETFNPGVHPQSLKMTCDGREVCTDIFQPIVHIGQPISVGTCVFKHKCLPSQATDDEAIVEIYESKSECPTYTIDEGVRKLGEITVSMSNISKGKNRPIEVEVSFGYTEINVHAYEEGTHNRDEGHFNCLHT